ncbi:MAG: ZIP family metal transporter [Candidatus Cyclobacteriaceae bacterium M3_2C_046]
MIFSDNNLINVIILASITAVATGLGAVPFFFFKNISGRYMGYANAIAAGLMLAASFKLLEEGIEYNLFRTMAGMMGGLLMIHFSEKLFPDKESIHIGQLKGANAVKALLIVGVMTLHSFAEGIGVGVSFAGEENFGLFISAAIAIHNIPEGLAISIVLVPKNISPFKAMLWSIFSSLPQPLIAIPAFMFVDTFQQYLPVGLGLAAGAMIWMVHSEIIPDALEDSPKEHIALITTVAIAAMIIFQELIRA